MNISQITHVLAILAGALGIIAGSAAVLGLPVYVTSGLGVVIAVLVYVSNQLPSLTSGLSPPASNVLPATTDTSSPLGQAGTS